MAAQRKESFSSAGRQQAAAVTAEGHRAAALPELRLVLLGRKGAGKSSAGNTILGLAGGFETSKPTEECVKRRADVAGWRVTVVDTPGWEWYYSANGTPGWVRRETLRSVSLCPPGPHAVLLVVRSCTSVTAEYHQQIEDHLELLGKTVWDHTLVLFTRGDELGSIPIEQRIKNGGQAFQRLLERCGNRFHVLENKRRVDDGTQVKELLRKMEKLVGESGGRYYETDPLLLELEEESKRRARERRKKQRLMEAQTQRGTIRAVLMNDNPQAEDLDDRNLFSRGSRRLPELRLVLLGERETGKSSAGNAILGRPGYFKSREATEECCRRQAEVSNRLVTVVDVPGWEGGPEGLTPERVKREIGMSVALCPPGPHAFLLTLRVDALVQAPAVREHLELLGETVWRHTLLLFTRGDQLREGVTIEQHIQGGGKDLHLLMEKCSNRFHVISSNACLEGRNSALQITGLLEKIEKMASGNRCEAFSPLVHEIQDLGRQKNEKFQLKVKEFCEKLQRQEEELKKMKEREVKSIRWFFDRRKKDKVQSPGKTEREEVPYRGEDDRRSIMGELEDRMSWLTEDKEREIQELTTEMSRVMAALQQTNREKQQLMMRLDEKDREGDELKEKVDELQMKLLELERMSHLKEQDRKERETEFQQVHHDDRNKIKELEDKLFETEKEKNQMKRKGEETQKEMDALQRRFKKEAEQKEQEMEDKLKEKDNKISTILTDKEKEIKDVKLKAESREREQSERWREIDEKREKEMDKLREMIEMITKEMEELQMSYQEQIKTTEAERQIHAETVDKYNTLIDKLMGKDEEIVTIRNEQELTKREKEKELNRNIETQEKLQQKEKEIEELRQRGLEKDREIDTLKKDILEKQRDIELRDSIQTNITENSAKVKRLQEEELKIKDEEITKLKQQDLEKDREINTLMQDTREKLRDIDTLKKSIQTNTEESAAQVKHLQEVINLKEEEIDQLKQTDMEKDREIDTLKQNMIVKQKDIEELKNSIQESNEDAAKLEHLQKQFDVKIEDYKRKNKMIEETTDRIKTQYEEKIRQTEEKIRLTTEMKDNIINQLQQQHANIQRATEELRQQHREEQERNNILQNTNTELEKELEELRLKCESCERDLQTQREEGERRENEMKETLDRYEMQKTKDSLSLEQMKGQEHEINQLKQMNFKQQTELEELKEREREKERKMNEMKVHYEKRQTERKEELDVKQTEREQELHRREKEVEYREENLSDRLTKLQQNIQNLEIREAEIIKREKELKEEKQNLEENLCRITDKEKNLQIECQNNNSLMADLERMREEIELKQQELIDSEEKLKIEEQKIKHKEEELKAMEKLLESRENEARALTEKEKKTLENLRQQLEKRDKELMEMEQKFVKEQHSLKEEEKSLEVLRVNLEQRENEFNKREQQLTDAEQMWKVKISESSKELENTKHDIEKWQAELSNKEHDLMQRINGLQKKEQELIQKEQDLELKDKTLMELKEGLENREKEQLNNLYNQTVSSDTRELELESIKEMLGKREQKLKSEEIYLEKKQQVLQKREEQVQHERQQNENMLHSLKQQQDVVKDKERSLDARETELRHLETELNIKDETLTDKDKFLQSRELDIKKKENDFENKTQMLENVKITLEGKERELEECKNHLQSRTQDLNNEQDHLKKKQEELEKWEKYLYNEELKVIHKEPLTGYQRWTTSAEFNGTQEAEHTHRMYQEVGVDGNICDGDSKETRSNGFKTVDRAITNCEYAKHRAVKSGRAKKTLEAKQKEEDEEICAENDVRDTSNEESEDFFEPSSAGFHLTHGTYCPVSELRLMLLGDTWSSRHSLRHTILGPDAEGGNPWRGEISGRRLTIVEPQGIRWRSDRKDTFQKHFPQSMSLCQPGPHAFILLIPAYVSVTGQYRRSVERTMSLLGEGAWKHSVVLLTWGETLGESVLQHVKRNGDLEWLVRKCGSRCHVLNNTHRESHMEELLEKVEKMLAKNDGRYYKVC